MNKNLFPVQVQDGVGIYAQIVDHKTKKIGRFQVHSTREPYDGNEYSLLTQAVTKQKAMIGVQNIQSAPNPPKNGPHPNKKRL